ncbi:class I SAM-dependent methyltransferase, partial [Bacteroidota bacterium]
IVEERAGKKMAEQSSDEPYNKMSEFWDDRYRSDEYVYGLEPNEFFKETIDGLKPGKILLPADGEGRNSVYAAIKGWKVDAFDFSRNAVKKALELAGNNKVKINCYIDELENLSSNKNSYDAIALIFVHLTPDLRKIVHKNIVNLLNPGGILILEAFEKEQINNDTGGPKNIDLLFSKEELEGDFQNLEIDFIEQVEKNINEGKYHTGKSVVIRLFGHKRK